MRSLYRNDEPPFALLPYTTQRDLIEHAFWATPIGYDFPTEDEAERVLRSCNATDLVHAIANMEKHRAQNPRLYRSVAWEKGLKS